MYIGCQPSHAHGDHMLLLNHIFTLMQDHPARRGLLRGCRCHVAGFWDLRAAGSEAWFQTSTNATVRLAVRPVRPDLESVSSQGWSTVPEV